MLGLARDNKEEKMTLIRFKASPEQDVDLSRTYDAIVVGSGAAGGMAAHVLTSQGMKVLMLEAARRSTSIPSCARCSGRTSTPAAVRHLRDTTRCGSTSTTSETALRERLRLQARVLVCRRLGWIGLREEHFGGREGQSLHRHEVRLGARAPARRQDEHLGPPRAATVDYDFKGKTHDGYGEDWPISYADIEPYYDKVDLYLGISGHKENLPHLPDSLFQRPNKLTASEVKLRKSLATMGRTVTPYRAGVTTDGVKNKYRSKCFGRGACGRRPGGCDIHAAFDSPTD